MKLQLAPNRKLNRMLDCMSMIAIAALLISCASNPLPEAPDTVRITPPASHLGLDLEPAAPDPDTSTQLDAADYLNDLHAWGKRGWARVLEIKTWTEGAK